MRVLSLRLLAYPAAIALFAASMQAASAGPNRPKILVVVAPLASYVTAITGIDADVTNLLQSGQDPHHFALTPSQAEALSAADILIIPDKTIHPTFNDFARKYPKLKIVALSDLPGANPLPYAAENRWLAAGDAANQKREADEHALDQPPLKSSPNMNYKHLDDFNAEHVDAKEAPSARDPHLWLDPERMAAIAPALADTFGTLAPGYRKNYEANAKAVAEHLRKEVVPAVAGMLKTRRSPSQATKPELPFVTYHAAYQYFLGRFGVEDPGSITVRPEDYLGAKTMSQLLTAAKQTKVRCLIGESETTLVSRIAELSGAKVILLSPELIPSTTNTPDWVQNDYDRLIYATAQGFASCL